MNNSDPDRVIDFLIAGKDQIVPLLRVQNGYKPIGSGITAQHTFQFSKSNLNKKSRGKELLDHFNIIKGNGQGKNAYDIERVGKKFNNYHPRIFRPSYPHGTSWHEQNAFIPEFITARAQASRLVESVAKVCETIQPNKTNLKSHGMALQELLILICAAIEGQWKGIMDANEYTPPKGKYSTNDYVKLQLPLALKEYQVVFSQYPALKPFSPFKNWDSDRPSQSLTWYEAYNKVKHNYVTEMHQANLENLLSALAALLIILASQMGERVVFFNNTSVRDFMHFSKSPQLPIDSFWKLEELYYPLSDDNQNWISNKFSF